MKNIISGMIIGFGIGLLFCHLTEKPKEAEQSFNTTPVAVMVDDKITQVQVHEDALRNTFRTAALFGYNARVQGYTYAEMTNVMELGWVELDRRNKK